MRWGDEKAQTVGLALSQLLNAFILIPDHKNLDRVRKEYMYTTKSRHLAKDSQKWSDKKHNYWWVRLRVRQMPRHQQTFLKKWPSLKRSANLTFVEKKSQWGEASKGVWPKKTVKGVR
jgi:hypothetical protein